VWGFAGFCLLILRLITYLSRFLCSQVKTVQFSFKIISLQRTLLEIVAYFKWIFQLFVNIVMRNVFLDWKISFHISCTWKWCHQNALNLWYVAYFEWFFQLFVNIVSMNWSIFIEKFLFTSLALESDVIQML
jgi:hypothetical protein